MAKINVDGIVAGLGGADNIDEVEGCITRLRTVVVDPSLVDKDALALAGAMGVVATGDVVQVVVGPEAELIAEDIGDLQ
ncbi:PTS glucose/sucrose transporter subunit IIB [uncultured Corynebacterium sp.]|uniref:PTS glucose/sucrose transporter subunit IIB n=1 Tax=uncultured Corynebacterium sp. TaxID=159447 RepID=UPI0025FB3AEC|nr:PTS glucose/sucrose transporter subunit IIB [uncultured Corynebacterium sp.]